MNFLLHVLNIPKKKTAKFEFDHATGCGRVTVFLPENVSCFFFAAYTTFFIMGLLMSMQVPFVGFQPIRTSEHMAAAGLFPNLICM